ncbi:MAG TPA: hypothetical protein DDZ42_23940 [Candidatus Rokubacteria bacterium]|nr:MAG: hypothetical protein A2050_00720 [Candidatus Rokubacteria bacterium GWA2_73_35]HAM58453.1 hypothetical protein [Candidatus Rokubacteria bacterium]HBH04922.1 hypothetical protein [Candidatus Rokubacteria bacterium]
MTQKAKFLTGLVLVGALGLFAIEAAAASFEITPAIQAELDKQKAVVAKWVAAPAIVSAVAEQNRKGPIAGMDNAKWKVTRRNDPMVTGFQSNAAGQFLKAKLAESQGAISEAFLNAAQGEKVAFFEKTTSYIHRGSAKFDVPFNTGKSWQGKPEFDESSQTYAIQISVPVLAEGKTIGALVVGVNLSYLEKVAKK